MAKVLLIGWDGADWKVILPLIDAGAMPHLASLVERGVMGNLATLYPSLSPMLWTSIATGKRPFKHGVCGFTEPNPHAGGIRPITNLSRKARALWNLMTLQGLKSNVVGWWPSHPAEPIDGVMVSDHFHKPIAPPGEPWPMAPGIVHPQHLGEHLAKLRLHAGDLMSEHIYPFVPLMDDVDQEKDKRLVSVARSISEATTIHAAATALIQLEPWDLMAVYYDAIDHFCHGFMQYHPPQLDWVSDEDYEIYKGVVEGGYRYHDLMLGALLELAGEDTTVILISDHGFHPDHLRPRGMPREPAGPAVQHRHHGIFVMRGPGVKQDERIDGASLLDICPTILSIYGLPVGEDMDGRPLLDAFEQRPEAQTIPSWDDVDGEDGMHPADRQVDPVEAQAAIDQLVALGYIERPNEDRERAVAETVRELDYNRARSYMDADLQVEAVPILDRLTQEWPAEHRFSIQLLACHLALDRVADARYALERMLDSKERDVVEAGEALQEFKQAHEDTKPEDLDEKERHELRDLISRSGRSAYAMQYLTGVLLFSEGDEEAALEHLQRAEAMNLRRPDLYNKIGQVYLRMKRWDDAEGSFRKALEVDPENAFAHAGLSRSYLPRRRDKDAAAAATRSVGLVYHNPTAHFTRGVALHRVGRIDEAVEALRVALAQNPNYPAAHRRLAYIYARRLGDRQSALDHRQMAKEANRRLKAIKSGKLTASRAQQEAAAQVEPLLAEPDVVAAPGSVDLSETIAIVSGLPRSGTSMMVQMLRAGGLPPLADDSRGPDSGNPRGYYEHEKAKLLRTDRSWVADAKGKAVKVVAQLLGALPIRTDGDPPQRLDYRVIFMERDLTEVLASQRKLLAQQGKDGADLSDERLERVFASQVRQVKRFLSARKIPTLYVSYADAIRQPEEAAQRVNAFMAELLDEEAMASAVEPTLYRQRRGPCW